MASYYELGASLPELSVDDTKVGLSCAEFVHEFLLQATPRDRELIELVLLNSDNKIVLAILQGKALPELYLPSVSSAEKIREYIALQEEDELDSNPKAQIPSYLQRFIRKYLAGDYKENSFFTEDILHSYYLEYASSRANEFLLKWFQLCQYISSILAAKTAKKYGLDSSQHLIGDTELMHILRSSSWSELNHFEEADTLQKIVQISEEKNLVLREKKLDSLKWDFLNEYTFADPFSINAMLSYLLKLQIKERWVVLDRDRGIERFHQLLSNLKKQGKEQLQTFLEETSKQKHSPTVQS